YLPKEGTLKIPGEKRFLEIKRGEALFLRARHYFYHMNTYGAVPLINSFNDAERFPKNSTISEIYAQIIADLSEAETLLPGWKDSENEPGRATRGAAKSLLGRVYLTKATSEAAASDDYQKASSKLKEVIDNEGYDLWENYKDAFIPENENGKEDIHSYQCQPETNPSSIYIESVPNPNPAGSTDGYIQMLCSQLLFDSFEEGDKRKEDGWWEDGSNGLMFTGDYTVRTTGEEKHANYICHEKFYDPVNTPLNVNNSGANFPLIRYADVLLMYAEALNEVNNGPNDQVYWAINKVRARAGLDPLSGLSKESFFDALVDERFHELWFEGIRWFDLKRWGMLKERVLMREHITGFPDIIPIETPKHLVFPYPLSEIQVNENLIQNAGY
ncbi:RagB/SusD family nutrient uptake outer membrane protein, partial [Mariniphaga sediminis]|uniref:RagB/SusD family nutrient uptake outer membrane protein n=1 Tax=Mariniphaga sediminis TaxID=1628158 RepID=UPI003564C467